MYIRINSTPNSPRKSIQIVESKREGNKVKQKIVRYVGVAQDDDEVEKLQAYGEELIIKIKAERAGPGLFEYLPEQARAGRPKAKRLEDILPPSKVKLDEIEEEQRLVEGIHEIAGQLYDDLGLNNILAR